MFLDFRADKITLMDEEFFETLSPDEQVTNILPMQDTLLTIDSKSKLTKYLMLFTQKSLGARSDNSSSKTGSLSS